MNDAIDQIMSWSAAGESAGLIAAGAVVAACFVVFNAIRVIFYIPQIATCWSDRQGCPTINLLTWCSWLIANASTGLYMWMFQGDVWGLFLNLGNALMCGLTVGITVVKRQRHLREAERPFPSSLPPECGSARPSRALAACGSAPAYRRPARARGQR